MLKNIINKRKTKILNQNKNDFNVGDVVEEAKEAYGDQDKILKRGITVPKVPSSLKISIDDLKVQYARSTLEMNHNVQKGTHPAFGYPLICYSPV